MSSSQRSRESTRMFAPNSVIETGTLWRVICVCLALLGLYLACVGWMPARSRQVPQTGSSTSDLPRAA
jgi:hypothetical protein